VHSDAPAGRLAPTELRWVSAVRSLRDEYRAHFGAEEGDRLHDAVQAKMNAGLDEALSVDWWRMVARQRAAGEAAVGRLLDDLCCRWGMDPVEVWRRPRQAEIDDGERHRRWALDVYSNRVATAFGFAIMPQPNGRVTAGLDI